MPLLYQPAKAEGQLRQTSLPLPLIPRQRLGAALGVALRRRDVGLGEPGPDARPKNTSRSRIGPKITIRSYGAAGAGPFTSPWNLSGPF